MAKININDELIVNGKMTIRRYETENASIRIAGTFATHGYIDEIHTLTSYRYRLTGIRVYEEVFGSDDYDIVYNFTAESIEIPDGLTNLEDVEMNMYDEKLYNKAGFIKGSTMDRY